MAQPRPPAPPAPAPAVAAPQLTTQQFIEIGKIPDFVKDVKQYNGNPTELINWISDVDAIFRVCRDQNATAIQISVLERTIRRKVGGEAANILNANNIECSWRENQETLILYYRDKRDLKTLDYELTSIKKLPNENLNSYYSRVNELLSYIIAQVQTDQKLSRNAAVHIDFFRDKSLDAFVRGLERTLSILLKSSNPQNLSQAYQFCVEYYNMDVRTAPYRNELGNQPVPKPREPPRVPPRQNFTSPHQYQRSQPQPAQRFLAQTNTRPTLPPRPSNLPEPMDVDPSIRTKNINYSNCPQTNFKRPLSQAHQQSTYKKQAHPVEDTNQQQTQDTETLEHEYGCDYEYEYEYEQPEQQEQEVNSQEEANFLEWRLSW